MCGVVPIPISLPYSSMSYDEILPVLKSVTELCKPVALLSSDKIAKLLRLPDNGKLVQEFIDLSVYSNIAGKLPPVHTTGSLPSKELPECRAGKDNDIAYIEATVTCSGAMNCVEVRDDAMIHSSEYVSSNTVIRRLRTMKYRARVYSKLYALWCRGSDLSNRFESGEPRIDGQVIGPDNMRYRHWDQHSSLVVIMYWNGDA